MTQTSKVLTKSQIRRLKDQDVTMLSKAVCHLSRANLELQNQKDRLCGLMATLLSLVVFGLSTGLL